MDFEHFQVDSSINYSNDRVVAWLDDTYQNGDIISNIEVIGKLEDIFSINQSTNIVVSIGYNHLLFKWELIRKIKSNNSIQLYTFIHLSAYIDKSAIIEPGVIVFLHSTIDFNVKLETGVLINNFALISHDSTIGMEE